MQHVAPVQRCLPWYLLPCHSAPGAVMASAHRGSGLPSQSVEMLWEVATLPGPAFPSPTLHLVGATG